MAEKMKIDVTALRGFVAKYKENFTERRLGKENEIYKWKAVKCFQDNWDIDATDFPTMLKASLAKTGNLLDSWQLFPKKMLEEFAGVHTETMRDLFRALFDENEDVIQRVKAFEEGTENLLISFPKLKRTYQNPNSISTYLWLRYPDKHYIYKSSIAKQVARVLFGIDFPKKISDRMPLVFSLYDAVREELSKDAELVAMSRDSLDGDCYADETLKTLTIDFCRFVYQNSDNPPAPSSRTLPRMINKNTLLYGAPGTGKTYSTVQYAVSIIEENPLETIQAEGYDNVLTRYLGYKNDGLIEFTTFHQSFGYEEFIEGIRPVVFANDDADNGKGIEYEVHDGIFKAFCDKAGMPVGDGTDVDFRMGKNPKVWKVSLGGTGENTLRSDCMENGYIRIALDGYGETISDSMDYNEGGKMVLNAFYNRMQIGDLVLSCYSNKTIDAIGVVTGEAEWHDDFPKYKRLRKVKWLVKGINEDIVDMNAGKAMTLPSVHKLSVSVSDAVQILKKKAPLLFTAKVKIPNRVMIIDEFNRGNISKIFGELITLIEPTKRIGASEELRVLLPYSGKHFGVPDNVYIIGTMNTADRSIAMMDTALRRRFHFVEMQPNSELLKDVVVEDKISIAKMLDTMNRRITVLFDREHVIGHSYLLPLKDDPSIEKLAEIFEGKIVPLLQEYFYDDYEKIRLVLGDNQKTNESVCFVVKKNVMELFGNANIDHPEYYEVNREAFKRIEAYEFLH